MTGLLDTAASSSAHVPEQINSLYIAKPLDAYQKVIITTNNIERVRESLKIFLAEIDHHNQQKSSSTAEKVKTVDRSMFETCISNTSDYLIQVIEQTLDTIVNTKIISDIKAHMFYLFESPESTPAQESISRIVAYLDTNLATYKEYAYKVNFERLLKLIWIKLLGEIDANLKKDDMVFKKAHLIWSKTTGRFRIYFSVLFNKYISIRSFILGSCYICNKKSSRIIVYKYRKTAF